MLRRTGALKRKTPLRSRGRTKYAHRPRDLEYMQKVRKLPCVVRCWDAAVIGEPSRRTTCWGRVEADHAGERALGQKSADNTTISLCRAHHRERTDYHGTFAGFGVAQMRAFCDWAIGVTRRHVKEMTDAT
jgi:hypothetical protein